MKSKTYLDFIAPAMIQAMSFFNTRNIRSYYMPSSTWHFKPSFKESCFEIVHSKTTNNVTMMYSDMSDKSVVRMPAIKDQPRLCDVFVANMISDHGLLAPMSIRMAIMSFATNASIIADSVIFEEYLRTWFNGDATDNTSLARVNNFINAVMSRGEISMNELANAFLPVIFGQDKYFPYDIPGCKRIFSQRMPIAFTISAGKDAVEANAVFDPVGKNDGNEIYVFDKDYKAVKSHVSAADSVFYQRRLLELSSSAYDNYSVNMIMQVEVLNHICHYIYTSASVYQNDKDYMRIKLDKY